MSRKDRSDSLQERNRIARGATAQITPPSNVPLEPADMPFFASVIAEFARSDWSEHQLEIAATLARKMCDLERNQRLLREEGEIDSSPRGTPILNPRVGAVRALDASVNSFRRTLALDARGRVGDQRDIAARRTASLEADADARSAAENDDLIARN